MYSIICRRFFFNFLVKLLKMSEFDNIERCLSAQSVRLRRYLHKNQQCDYFLKHELEREAFWS